MDAKIRARYLRVNHAGELGAINIYKGQLAVLGKTHLKPTLEEMLSHEQEHLAAFNEILPDEGVRPSLLTPVWELGGFFLGAGSALLGEKAAMACTVAVEEVIVDHYEEQLAHLSDDDPLKAKIAKFCADEEHHRQEGIAHGAEEWQGFAPFRSVVKILTKTCVAIAKHV